MAYKQTTNSHPRYLAATDLLIGDMSDINYEFLLFNRPIVLLANDWLCSNFPEIGPKVKLKELSRTLDEEINNKNNFENARKEWLKRTIFFPPYESSEYILNLVMKHANLSEPNIYLVHGNNSVRKSNLYPLFKKGHQLKLKISLIKNFDVKTPSDNNIFIAVHFIDLLNCNGYNVHLDHGLKGKGTANLDMSINDYTNNDYFPNINLHITAGEEGYIRTSELLLGPNKERAIIGGYPKADSLLTLNSDKNRMEVFKKLKLDPKKPLITYAPSGILSYEKPGGSLNYAVLRELRRIEKLDKYNILVKLKNRYHSPYLMLPKNIKSKLIEFYRRKLNYLVK